MFTVSALCWELPQRQRHVLRINTLGRLKKTNECGPRVMGGCESTPTTGALAGVLMVAASAFMRVATVSPSGRPDGVCPGRRP